MAYPPGVSLAVINAGNAFTAFGGDSSLTVTVVPRFPKAGGGFLSRVVHAASGWVMTDETQTFIGQTGAELSFSVPHVDQAGWRDPSQQAYTGWYYEVTVTVGPAKGRGKPTTYKQTVQPVIGQSLIDLDLVPDGPVGSPTWGPVPEVVSVNGMTGAVVIDSAATLSATETEPGVYVIEVS